MKFFIFLYIIFLFNIYFFYCQNIINSSNSINNQNNEIQDAVYIIRNRKGDKNLDFKNNNNYPVFLDETIKSLKKNFLITKDINNINKTGNNMTYYFIQDNTSKNKIGVTKKERVEKLSYVMNEELALWNIIPKINSEKQLIYYVQNKKSKKFWQYNPIGVNHIILTQTTDINNLTIYNEFQFIKIYRESEKFESKLLNDEPIDVLIKYIDLSDPNLVREGIPQIKKDEDNKELKYSVRSILENIPWIRKIFILMPNEKVSYFKSAEEIKEKIIYVKDKDLLGFDSASSPSFQFNLHKMKKFGLTENFILMDDDCFIAKPLKKAELFYEENGKIYPNIITSDYYEMDKIVLHKKLLSYLSKPESKFAHSTMGFHIQHSRSLLLMYDIFGDDNKRNGKKLIEPAYTHNAIPVKISDIEEIHDLIVKYYPFYNETLAAISRSVYSLQMQTVYMAYVKNQYDRKVSIISSAFYDLTHYRYIPKNNKELFVINTGSKEYKKYYYKYERKVLQDLFPNKSKYELENDNDTELEEFLEIENNVHKLIYKDVLRYKTSKINIITQKINISFLKLNKKIKKTTKIINNLKMDDNKKILINYSNIFSEEIKYLDNECKKLDNINYKLLYIIIFFVCCKFLYYLRELNQDNIERNKKIDLVI